MEISTYFFPNLTITTATGQNYVLEYGRVWET